MGRLYGEQGPERTHQGWGPSRDGDKEGGRGTVESEAYDHQGWCLLLLLPIAVSLLNLTD